MAEDADASADVGAAVIATDTDDNNDADIPTWRARCESV